MIVRQLSSWPLQLLLNLLLVYIFVGPVSGSLGDRLPDFRNCVSVEHAHSRQPAYDR